MTPNDCILMMSVQLAETTSERDMARQQVAELQQTVADLEQKVDELTPQPANGSGVVKQTKVAAVQRKAR